MSDIIKSYKGFDKDLCCCGFQYEVGKEYEIEGEIECCRRGFHACESPLEVFDHYDMLTSRFCEVEQSGEIDRGDEVESTKVCSSKIKVKAELKLADLINIGVEWLKKVTLRNKIKDADINSSGNYAKIGSSGNYAKIGSSGNSAQIGSSGNSAQIGSSGVSAKIGSSGNSAKIGSSGDYAKIGSSGNSAQIGSSGNSAQIGSSGNYAKIGSSGNFAKIGSSGEDSVIMCAGLGSVVKAKVGSWITLAEWEYNKDKGRRVPTCVKTEFVDGERIKGDTWYKLEDGEFKEVEERQRAERQHQTEQ